MAKHRRTSRRAKVSVQIRSVNHRHLDLQVRAPREYLSFEEDDSQTHSREDFPRPDRSLCQSFAAKGQSAQIGDGRDSRRPVYRPVNSPKKNLNWPGKSTWRCLATMPDLFHVREVEIDSASERKAVFKALSGGD